MKNTVLKNTAWGSIGELVVRSTKIVQVILIAQLLGSEDLGRYMYAVALVGLYSVMFDFGVLPVAVKLMVQDPQSSIFRICAILKLLTSIIGLLLLYATVILYSRITSSEAWTIFGIGLYLAITDLGTFVVAAYRVRGEFWRESFYRSTTAVVQLIACLLALTINHTLEALVWVMIGVALVGALPLVSEWIRQPVISFTTAASKYLRRVLYECLPIAGSIIAGSVYMNFDTAVLGDYVTLEEVGWYGVAVKSIFGMFIVPLFYLLSASYSSFANEMKSVGEREMNARWMRGFVLSTTVGAVLSILIAILANYLILLLFGSSFTPAAPILVVFTINGFIFYLYSPLAQWLLLHGRQKITLYIHVVATAVNVLAVLVGIAYAGLWGAVLAALLTHATIALAHAWIVFRDGNFSECCQELHSLCRLLIATVGSISILFLEIGGIFVSRPVAIIFFLLIGYREIFALAVTLRSEYRKFLISRQ